MHNPFRKNSFAKLTYQNVDICEGCSIDAFSKIGEYTYIGKNCLITKSTIGRYVSIGNNVSIGPGEHDVGAVSTSAHLYYGRMDWYDALTKDACTIGNDVWIGTDSIVRRGVTVGNGVVIGANSFVNKHVPDYAIVAGNPARIIRFRFEDKVIKQLNESKWWEMDLEDARLFCMEFEKKLRS